MKWLKQIHSVFHEQETCRGDLGSTHLKSSSIRKNSKPRIKKIKDKGQKVPSSSGTVQDQRFKDWTGGLACFISSLFNYKLKLFNI